jgi:hypothetical protein
MAAFAAVGEAARWYVTFRMVGSPLVLRTWISGNRIVNSRAVAVDSGTAKSKWPVGHTDIRGELCGLRSASAKLRYSSLLTKDLSMEVLSSSGERRRM